MTALAPRPWIVIALATGIAIILVVAFRLVAAHLPAPSGPVGGALIDAAFTAALYGALAAAALAGMRAAGLPTPGLGDHLPAMAGLGGAIGLATLLAALTYATLAGVAHRVPTHASPVLLALGTLAVAIQAGGEEVYFRGWLQRALARDWPPVAALLVAATAFALLHLLGGTRAPLSLVNILLAGLLFGLLRERTGGLAAPIAAHIAYNWAETLLFGLDPNPGTGSFGAFHDLDLVGAAAWGGSSEGLNASVGLTIALAAAILPLAATWPARALRLSAERRPA